MVRVFSMGLFLVLDKNCGELENGGGMKDGQETVLHSEGKRLEAASPSAGRRCLV